MASSTAHGAARYPMGDFPFTVSSGVLIDARTGQVSYPPDDPRPAPRCLCTVGLEWRPVTARRARRLVRRAERRTT